MSKLWGGRFVEPPDDAMWAFNASIKFDIALAPMDVKGSIAWVNALKHAGVFTESEANAITDGLSKVLTEIESGAFETHHSDEDVHTAVERRLREIVGGIALKLHTGRSRNDQVATDLRLYIMDRCEQIIAAIRRLQSAIIDKAENNIKLIMPGYTHLQRAQPIRFAHWLMAYFWGLERDISRFEKAKHSAGFCPLGSAALAGTAYNIDRTALALELGFHSVCENSLDAVSDRDAALELLFACAVLGSHLSRLAEDVIIYSAPEFGFLKLAEKYSTGSSIMPQKRNPDSFELIRAKTGSLTGGLMSLLMILKGLPTAYDKDMQEDKIPVFASVETVLTVLPVCTGALATLSVNAVAMEKALSDDLLATELADYLVEAGLPFRSAHEIVGEAVKLAESKNIGLSQLDLADYQALSPLFDENLFERLTPLSAVERRKTLGGTALSAVQHQIDKAKTLLKH